MSTLRQFNWEASDPGFTDSFYETMKANYRANLNVEGCGAVVSTVAEIRKYLQNKNIGQKEKILF